ncbi:hypothetical protein VB773_03410 [Haloarculaceae archaeon H-GB2-1]|nr:hypothetical protein [Haloarculaceae archaeon H-GB1-1]MEA5388669.1 hypothetical protein [Haloarculaceae archaeon H-GB11]MEA5406722.1 hypothetical protein [Haloarculaceae archaeon H-GB2-1]
MATESADRISSHRRGMMVTSLAAISGILSGIASTAIASSATDPTGLFLVGAAISVQFPLLKLFGIDIDDFGAKDYIYVAFMTFSLWFVSWGILLTTHATV